MFIPGSMVHGVNIGPIWGRQDPGGPNVGHINFAMWDVFHIVYSTCDSIVYKFLLNLSISESKCVHFSWMYQLPFRYATCIVQMITFVMDYSFGD